MGTHQLVIITVHYLIAVGIPLCVFRTIYIHVRRTMACMHAMEAQEHLAASLYIYMYLIMWDIGQYGKLLHECVRYYLAHLQPGVKTLPFYRSLVANNMCGCTMRSEFNWLKLTGQYNWAIWENIAQCGIGNYTLLGNMAR